MNYPQVFMVERQLVRTDGFEGAWIGQSIHLTQGEAEAACIAGDRVTPFIVRNPERTVKRVSKNLSTREARMGQQVVVRS